MTSLICLNAIKLNRTEDLLDFKNLVLAVKVAVVHTVLGNEYIELRLIWVSNFFHDSMEELRALDPLKLGGEDKLSLVDAHLVDVVERESYHLLWVFGQSLKLLI